MASTSTTSPPAPAGRSFLSRENIVAGPGFNRWLFPPAALAVHLSIGQVYAFSVFKSRWSRTSTAA